MHILQKRKHIIANNISKIAAKFNYYVGPPIPFKFSPHISFLFQLKAIAAAKCESIFNDGEVETWEDSMTWIM